MEKIKFVSDLEDKENFKDIFLCSEKQLMTDKNGKNYLNLNLVDKSGLLNARLWDRANEFDLKFNDGDFLMVKGHVQIYQGRRQIVVHDLSKVSADRLKIEDFLSSSKRPSAEMFVDLIKIVESLDDQYIKQVLLLTLNDKELSPLLLRAPAAKSIHHAYVGGLLEHILSICEIMNFLAKHYSFLRRDLLIFGAIYHDIGKVKELEVSSEIKYTDEGRLVGHLTMACEFVEKFSSQINDFPEETKLMCKHIVLSHHGKLEYGSPKRPKFLEALIVSMVDELDSRVDSMKKFMDQERDNGADSWSRYHSQYDRYFFLK